ncbi:predicted protein [Naegleria gruberi]|uniref:Predicted protein n=1 Tax=Naegleria gruberi TaxID=5762 RepID=D2V2Z0_NAEGR|nr:uncharacterized protein NAEGRDRAFT_63165 [Naegleria gruberi]EFC48691.1 predicted protein [Naegleria gruberi]|eukprot:XP_002681435.1 predicted protein [Naegleria gruberi strain NEG-M]
MQQRNHHSTLTILIFLIFIGLTLSCHAFSCNVGYDKLGNYYGATQSCPSGFVCYRYDLKDPNMGEKIYGFTPESNCNSWRAQPAAYPNLVCCASQLCNDKNAIGGATSFAVVDGNGNGTRTGMGVKDSALSRELVQLVIVVALIFTCFVL